MPKITEGQLQTKKKISQISLYDRLREDVQLVQAQQPADAEE
jgi:hypothetical protein